MGVGRGRESSRGGGREAVGCLEEGEMEREREEGKGEKELEVDRWKERGNKVARYLETAMVELEASFQLSLQELAVYHGKQKLESIKQANAGLCSR